MIFPSFRYKKHTFVCENCQKEVTERTSLRHIKQKRYCRKCRTNSVKMKRFYKKHPNYQRNWWRKCVSKKYAYKPPPLTKKDYNSLYQELDLFNTK